MTAVAPVSIGTRLGPYVVESRLGEGGMGDVWKARDERVNRSVAIKVLRDEFSDRFRREATAIAALNHPNICTLFDVGPSYLVMEFCDGTTLADRLRRGRLPLQDVLKSGAQIAAAIAEAHAKGIVHRDLKPANVMLVKSGAKVLDFGLAKSTGDETLTAAHVVVGTPAYMAPEQRRGTDAGARTDIYALGLILSEMATGTPGSVEGLTGAFAHVVQRCLADDPDERWQAAADVRAQLEWLSGQTSVGSSAAPRVPWRWITAAGVLIAAAGMLVGRFVAPPSPATHVAGAARLDLSLEFEADGFHLVPQPSPDGRYLAYLSHSSNDRRVIYVRALDGSAPQPLPGTEDARTVFWSSDSKWIGFVVDDKIKKIAPTAGAVQTLATVAGAIQEPAWGANGDILYRTSNREPLTRIREDGGAPELVTALDKNRTENSHRGQQFLPDGVRFLFTARCADRSMNALYLGSLKTRAAKRLMSIDSAAVFVSRGPNAGVVVYERDGALVARRLNLDREELEGDPITVLDRIGYVPSGLIVSFAASADGRVAIAKSVNDEWANLEWYSRSGSRIGTFGEPGQWAQLRISPDGTRVAATGLDPQTGNRDIFAFDMRGIPVRLTANVANDWYPLWSPDSKRIAFVSDRPEGGLFTKSAGGTASAEERLTVADAPEDWSRDGRWLIGAAATGAWVAEAKVGARTDTLHLTNRGTVNGLSFSPDGRWIAYTSSESGRAEVYVRGFQGPGVSPDALQISRGGGDFAVWSASGSELFYATADLSLWAFSTKGLAKGDMPAPVRLFRPCPGTAFPFQPERGGTFMRAYDTRDGQRFLVGCTVEPPGRFSILLNWPLSASEQGAPR